MLLPRAPLPDFQSIVPQDDGSDLQGARRDNASIDCVLLDLSMPRLDGEEVFIELRKIKRAFAFS